MPEVVEVCLTALWLNYELKNKVLDDIKTLSGRYSRHKMKGLELFKKTEQYNIDKIDSKGKFMWFELTSKGNKKLYILNKFGLSGEWGFTKYTHSGVSFIIKDKDGNKEDLYFTDQRNFGTIEITNDVKRLNKELDKIADDFLKTEFTNNHFYNRIRYYVKRGGDKVIQSRYDKEIIKVLMDQTAKNSIGSGLGNYLSVESLYRAKISPYTKIGKIYDNKKLSDTLSEAIKYTVKLSYKTAQIGYLEHLDPGMATFLKKLRKGISSKNNPLNFHPSTKLKKTDEFQFQVYGKKEDLYGNEVEGAKIIPGRTTYWVPKIQKEY